MSLPSNWLTLGSEEDMWTIKRPLSVEVLQGMSRMFSRLRNATLVYGNQWQNLPLVIETPPITLQFLRLVPLHPGMDWGTPPDPTIVINWLRSWLPRWAERLPQIEIHNITNAEWGIIRGITLPQTRSLGLFNQESILDMEGCTSILPKLRELQITVPLYGVHDLIRELIPLRKLRKLIIKVGRNCGCSENSSSDEESSDSDDDEKEHLEGVAVPRNIKVFELYDFVSRDVNYTDIELHDSIEELSVPPEMLINLNGRYPSGLRILTLYRIDDPDLVLPELLEKLTVLNPHSTIFRVLGSCHSIIRHLKITNLNLDSKIWTVSEIQIVDSTGLDQKGSKRRAAEPMAEIWNLCDHLRVEKLELVGNINRVSSMKLSPGWVINHHTIKTTFDEPEESIFLIRAARSQKC